ncbi:hypothetical protein CSB37_03030 [bacterium DOLZORAL124_38_8]|nr:MAG: hypothetical protein CSB37_03030 [bacterium DOLZORAL124_38_8]
MKKIVTLVLSVLFVSGISAHDFDWEHHFTNTQLETLFGYDTTNNYASNAHLVADAHYSVSNSKNFSIYKTDASHRSISVWVRNRNLRVNERYVLACRETNQWGSLIQAVNYDESQFKTYNQSKLLTVYNARSNTDYTCAVHIEEQYKKGYWRTSAISNSVAVHTSDWGTNADGSINVYGGRVLPPVNEMSRRYSKDRSVIRAVKVMRKPKEWRVVGPRYYQNEVFKNWLSTGPVYSEPIMR